MKIFVFFLLTLGLSCKLQSQMTSSKSIKDFEFTGLTFLTSRCNGICPDISMNLYDDKRIEISRSIYSKKGQIDTTLSGNFKGNLGEKEYSKIVKLMKAIDWDTTSFPKVLCCDGPITTLMFTFNGIYKRYKSMTPPESTRELILYLTEIGSKVILPRYNRPIDFEDFNL